MTKIYLLLFALLLSFVSGTAFAQVEIDTLFTLRQESIPPSDSGGRWLHSAVVLKSTSAYPQHVKAPWLVTVLDYGNYDVDSVWKLPDSAYYIADSITIQDNGTTVISSNPSKYIDSVYSRYGGAQLDFLLPAHGTLRIPITIRAITGVNGDGNFYEQGPPGDTVSHLLSIYAYSDSAGKIRFSNVNFYVCCIANFSAPYGVWQSLPLPANDSGGRWLPSQIDIESVSPFPTHLTFPMTVIPANSATDTLMKIADSTLYVADSINIDEDGRIFYTSGTPRKYIDTIHAPIKNFSATLDFLLPPHATIHFPILIRATGDPSYQFDTALWYFYYSSITDSNGKKIVWGGTLNIRCVEQCSGPFVGLDGESIDNKSNPAVIGGQPVGLFSKCLNCPTVFTTHATYKLSGEFTNSFTLPDTIFNPDGNNYRSLGFNGAPKSPIHDTLTATYTDCWGSITTRTPIMAYSTYPDGYQIRQLPLNLTAPFLGKTEGNAAVVINTSNFPITFRNVHAISYYDSVDFEVSAPAMIAAHDSGFVTVTLKDNDLYLDTIGTSRSATITGIIAPYQQELNFQDSTFSFDVSGTIDVYSPLYFSLIPLLKHGVHPAGIIFTSDVSSMQGPHTFLTVYGNNDPTTEYFGMPYYDDPYFTFTLGNYVGPGLTLPGYINPDTGGFFSPAIQVLTNFSGDSHHNYYTQMHWPRATDTITIDVLAIGTDAPPYVPPFDDVKPVATPSGTISIWPNPASEVLHVHIFDQSPMWISDALGRIVLKKELSTGYSDVDISNLPIGIYEIFLSEHRQAVKLQVFR